MTVGKLPPFDPVKDDFQAWVGVLDNYLIANGVDKTDSTKGGKQKAVAIFLSSVGVAVYALLKDLTSPDAPETLEFSTIVDTLQAHYKPAPKAIAERFKFFSRKQLVGESVTLFLSELRRLAVTCKFEKLDISLRDQFVFGLSSEAAQKRLFLEDDKLDLATAVAIATSQEAAESSTQLIRSNGSNSSPDSTNKVYHQKKQYHGSQPMKKNHQSSQSKSKCPNCGSNHNKKDCPHFDVECHSCHKKGHFSKYCRSSSNGKPSYQKGKVQSVKQVAPRTSLINVEVQVNGHQVKMELDTASSKSFISPKVWKMIGSPSLRKSTTVFQTYTGESFEAKGEFDTTIQYNSQCKKSTLQVADGSCLFGRDLLNLFQMDWTQIKSQCGQVNRVSDQTLNALLNEFSDVFDAPVGRIKGYKAKLVLKEDAVPRFFKPRPVPFAIRDLVDKELQYMEERGVIEKIEHSDWASPLVCVPKPNGKVRITGDFKKTINSQLCITQYPLARVEDLLESITGGSSFSKLDGSDAFHQVEIEESSRKFLVINTHRGLFRYNVLPQGIASSPAIFQELMDKLLKDIPMAGSFVDDVICSGKDDSAHLKTLRKIFEKMRACNYRLSRKKCLFMQKDIKFLGHIVCKDGIRTDPEKVSAIMSMKPPQDVSQVRSFLGLVNFYAKFVPHLSTICEPMNNLTRDGIKWVWSKSCQSAFDQVKKCVSSSQVLAHFCQSLPVGIACDASSVGLGVVLFHRYPDGKEKPIAYASKTLSSAEKNYSQIEKEGLAIIFGVKRFVQFLYGRSFILVTDHNPLLAIFGQNREVPSLVANRLHRWALFLSGFKYTIEYRNTHHHGNADALSRLPIADNANTDSSADSNVKAIVEENPVTSKNVRRFTSRDPVMSAVVRHVQQGWPSKQAHLPDKLRPYFIHRYEFGVENGILMWGLRVVVPAALQQNILKLLHEAHPGVVRMKSLARQYVWWPNIDEDIEALAKSCTSCAIHRANPAVAPLHPWQYPERPWQRIHMDLAGPFLGSMWLLIVDSYTKWPEVYKLGNNTTSASVINYVRDSFSRFGIPETIISDNGPQFVSREFERFCELNGVRHSTSSAYHPRSNGEAERFVRTFKEAMTSSDKKDLNLSLCEFLLSYRVTPHSTTGVSPSELMMKRKVRTLLDLIRPDVSGNVRAKQEQQEKDFNNKKPVREFRIGQQVWVQSFGKDQPKWSLGRVSKPVGPVSYQVEVDGRVMKRHVDHMLCAEPLNISGTNDIITPSAPAAVTSSPRSPVPVPDPVPQPEGSPVRIPSPVRVDEPVVPVDSTAQDDSVFGDSTMNSSRRSQRVRKKTVKYQAGSV